MGDIKKFRKKYQTPTHPWQKARLDEESALLKEYGFKNKTEIWKMVSVLRNIKQRIKKVTAVKSEQNKIERQHLLVKLQKLGLTEGLATEDEVLGITLKSIIERRLQTQLVRKGFARTMSQARQMIVHQHIMIGDKKITSPSYLVKKDEESKIAFVPSSGFSDDKHPERIIVKKEPKVKETSDRKEGRDRRFRGPQKRGHESFKGKSDDKAGNSKQEQKTDKKPSKPAKGKKSE